MNHMIINGQYAPEVKETFREVQPDKEMEHFIGNLQYLNDEVNAWCKYTWQVVDECQVEVTSENSELTKDLFMLCHILCLQITPIKHYTYLIEH